MKPSVLITPLILLATGLPAAALDFGDGFYAKGEFELEYSDGLGGSGQTLGYGSVDVGYQAPAGGIGGFLGFDAVSADGDDVSAIYGAISYSGGFGKLEFGVPRPAIDDYLETPTLGGVRLLDFFANVSTSLVSRTYLFSDFDPPLGLRYDGSFGDAKVGVSLHRFEDTNVLDVATNYQLGQTTLRAGIEHAWENDDSATGFSLGAESNFGPVKAGFLYTDTSDLLGARLAQLYAIYSPMDKLNLTGTIWNLDTGTDSTTLYGIAADYSFAQGTYVEAGFADGDDSSSIYNLSLGVKF